jgi:hypothetical protein
MPRRKTTFERSIWIVLTILVAGIVACVLLRASAKTAAHVPIEATFSGYTNSAPRERAGLFDIANLSRSHIRLVGYRVGGEYVQIPSPEEFEPKKRKAVTIQLPAQLAKGGKVELEFRREDSVAEEMLETVDALLRSVKVRVRGLNPNSSNEVKISCDVPAAVALEPTDR